jgi:hypothetical protein
MSSVFLSRFGTKERQAQRAYRKYMAEGVRQVRRPGPVVGKNCTVSWESVSGFTDAQIGGED